MFTNELSDTGGIKESPEGRVPDVLQALEASLVVPEDQHAMPINVSCLPAHQFPMAAFGPPPRRAGSNTELTRKTLPIFLRQQPHHTALTFSSPPFSSLSRIETTVGRTKKQPRGGEICCPFLLYSCCSLQELQELATIDSDDTDKTSTWSQVVAGKVATVKGQPTIIVDAGAVTAAVSAVATAAKDQDRVDDACLKAKKKVQDQAGVSNKKARRAAIAMLTKFCGKLQDVVDAEVMQDVSALAGPAAAKNALETPEESAKAERALFTNDLGGLKTTGGGAKKMAKNEAEAHALKRMAKKAIKQNLDKSNLACKLGMKKAKKAGDTKTLAAAKANCAKMKSVMVKMQKSIDTAVKDTAEGNEKKGVASEEKVEVEANMSNTIAAVKMQADQACAKAKEMASKAPAAKLKLAKMEAEKLCTQVHTLIKNQVSKMKAGVANIGYAPSVKATSGMPIPADEVKKLQAAASSMKQAEADTQAKADKICKLAKQHALGGPQSLLSVSERIQATEIAVDYCKAAEHAVKQQVVNDENVMTKIVRKTAKKYGLKVQVVRSPKGDATSQPFKTATPYKATDQLKHQATKVEKNAEASIDDKIAGQEAKIAPACKLAKSQLASSTLPASRKAALDKALDFCKNSKAMIVGEKKQMYDAIHKAAQEALKKYALHIPAAPKVAAQPSVLPKNTLKVKSLQKPSLTATMGKIKQLKNGMLSKAAVECHSMWDKVRKMEHNGDFTGHVQAQRTLVQEAKQFCVKAKTVVAKEMKVDTADLKVGLGAMKHFKKQSQALRHQAATKDTQQAAEALARYNVLRNAEKKRRAMSRKLKTNKQDQANFERIQTLAKAKLSTVKAQAAKDKLALKNMTPAQKAALEKTMQTNEHCKSILKNLQALRTVMSLLEDTLGQFDAMEAEMTLDEMEAEVVTPVPTLAGATV